MFQATRKPHVLRFRFARVAGISRIALAKFRTAANQLGELVLGRRGGDQATGTGVATFATGTGKVTFVIQKPSMALTRPSNPSRSAGLIR